MKEGLGIQVGEYVLSILLYSNDVVILSDSGETLQRILDVVIEYGYDINVKFGSEKSQALVVNRDDRDIGRRGDWLELRLRGHKSIGTQG